MTADATEESRSGGKSVLASSTIEADLTRQLAHCAELASVLAALTISWMARIEMDNVLGERVESGSGFEREFDAEEGLAERWSCSAVVQRVWPVASAPRATVHAVPLFVPPSHPLCER